MSCAEKEKKSLQYCSKRSERLSRLVLISREDWKNKKYESDVEPRRQVAEPEPRAETRCLGFAFLR